MSLGNRLPVPGTNDELQRLSETLNEMLDRIEGAFRRVTQFTADASHELRTPVALIRTTSEVALRRQRSESEYRQALDAVLSEAVRTTDLIENLLTLARADAGKAALERAPVELGVLISEVLDQGERLARQKGLDLVSHPAAGTLIVPGDRVSLRRLFLILIDNAVKYTQTGGRIEVSVLRRTGAAAVEVRDSGVGIGAGDLPHIFERFYRSDRSRSRDFGGAGLGLSLAKWIVDAHGGTIHVESEPERGSVFRVELPGVVV
jgi:signal transduction histidine kinase